MWLIAGQKLSAHGTLKPEHLAVPTAAQLADAPRQLHVLRCVGCHDTGFALQFHGQFLANQDRLISPDQGQGIGHRDLHTPGIGEVGIRPLFLLAELGYQDDSQDFVRMHEEFNRRLLQEARAGSRFIVVVDEAQNLAPEVLETVRLLSDFETPRAKLLQIILSGQPELATKLASAGLAQLRQRISIVNQLEPLPSWEIKNYIEHRLQIAGYDGESLFTPEALGQIAEFTEGNPRNVNNFCFNALSLACALRQKLVDSAVVKEVISDLDINKYVPVSLPADGSERRNGNLSASSRPQIPAQSNSAPSLSPADAKAYMQQVAEKLRNWQTSLEQDRGYLRAGGSRPN